MIASRAYFPGLMLPSPGVLLGGFSLIFTAVAMAAGITLNQALAITFSLIVVTAWFYDKFSGLIGGMLLYVTKPFWVRLAFMFDFHWRGNGGFDLLGITPALVVSLLIVAEIFSQMAKGERICKDKPRWLVAILAGISFLSIFNPSNSLLIGLGGFERNILPNMMILFLAASIVTSAEQVRSLLKMLLLLGVVSTAYGIGQHIFGLFPWEIDWIRQVAFRETSNGWLTIGLRGIEFRVFSYFYSYPEFFYTNVLIYSVLLVSSSLLTRGWQKLRAVYFALWILILALSLERMAIIMTALSTVSVVFMRASRRRRMLIAGIAISSIVAASAAIKVAGPFLIDAGAGNLVRLAELADPLSAGSINVRKEEIWKPAILAVIQNPLGIGTGSASASRVLKSPAKWQDAGHIQPHNEILQKALETGILGVVIFVMLHLSLVSGYVELCRSNGLHRSLGVGMISAALALWFCGMLNLTLSGASGLIYYTLAGATLGVGGGAVSNSSEQGHVGANDNEQDRS